MARTGVDGLTPEERLELAELIRHDGIVYSGADQAVVDRQGRRGGWGLYTPNVTLTSRGMVLAGRALLAKLATFSSTQIASSGFTSMPLLCACVTLGDGKYTGLIIRDKPKPYLLRRRIDGPGDPCAPVVVVDDSISSGTALFRAIEALEKNGFEVEGAVTLVDFPYRGGAERAYRHGYRIESVFDIWRDIRPARSETRTAADRLAIGDRATVIKSGLNPAVAVRRIAEGYLLDGIRPGAPEHFDADYDGRGGVWVSFRMRGSEHRVARDGFWHFDPERAAPCQDLVAATVKTIEQSRGAVTLQRLPNLKIAVTFFGPLERVTPAQLDFDRYGIVVRDTATCRKVGGALPNTQVFVSEMGQYFHACRRNARLAPGEPHELFRHDLVKIVEPGEEWLPYGIPNGSRLVWASDVSIGQALIDRVRALAAVEAIRDDAGQPLADGLVPYPICGAAVGFYHRGRSVVGVSLATSGPDGYGLDSLLCRASRNAVHGSGHDTPEHDVAWASKAGSVDGQGIDENSTIVVTLLHDPERHGTNARVTAAKVRRGRDCVVGSAGSRNVVALPTAIPYGNITRPELIASVTADLAPPGGDIEWSTYRTTAWVSGRDGAYPMDFGFPRTEDHSENHSQTMQLLAQHIVGGLDSDGLPTDYLDPVRGIANRTGTSARLVSALIALDEAGRCLDRGDWVVAARPGLVHCLDHVGSGDTDGALALPGQHNDILADCFLLEGALAANAGLSSHPAISSLAARVCGLLRPDGRISLRPVRLADRQDHDFLPGVAMWAAAAAASAGLTGLDFSAIAACLRWQQGRFRRLRSWAQAGWQPQAWAAMWEITGDSEHAEFVFEAADWAIDHQLEKTGAFLEGLAYQEPTFYSALVSEAIAAAWRVAGRVGDTSREDRYRRSWQAAMRFVRTLVIDDQDTFCMKDPERALGGVRMSITRSDIRIDAVSHALRALVAGEEVARCCCERTRM